jgi:hypothetical protein
MSNSKYEIIPADPATGILYRVNGFLSGHVRLRGRPNGSYPYKYLEMIDKVFGKDEKTLEVCSGTVTDDPLNLWTVDIDFDTNPFYCCDAQKMPAIMDNSFTRWRADPPYTSRTASKMYKTKMPSLIKLLKEGARVIRPGSLMFLLCSQNYQICPPGVKRIGIIVITVVPNNEIRACNIYQKLS